MKCAIVLCVLSMAVMALAKPNDAQYTDRYDSINLDELIENDHLMEPYFKCLIDKGKCTPDAKELKSHMKEALENKCAKCTPAQKKGTERIIKHLINNRADYWKQLCEKYDPEGKYTAKYEKELKEVKGQ